MTSPFWRSVRRLAALADQIPAERRELAGVTRAMKEDSGMSDYAECGRDQDEAERRDLIAERDRLRAENEQLSYKTAALKSYETEVSALRADVERLTDAHGRLHDEVQRLHRRIAELEQALREGLKALESWAEFRRRGYTPGSYAFHNRAIDAIRAALSGPAKEPT